MFSPINMSDSSRLSDPSTRYFYFVIEKVRKYEKKKPQLQAGSPSNTSE